ncbi:MAG: MFS transporter [Actinobacteria bacterium]|nr:MFS transporter [Actinomycetota bacterium]
MKPFRARGVLHVPGDIVAALAITVAGAFANSAVLPILAEIRGTFELPYVALGVVIAGFSLARVLFDLPGGALADRYAPRSIFYLSGLMGLVGVVLTALAPSYGLLLAGRLLNGAGAVVGSTAATAYVVRRSAPEDRGKALGAVVAAALFGGFLSPAIVGAVAAGSTWRIAVLTLAVPSVLALGLVSLTVRGAPVVMAAGRPPLALRGMIHAPRQLRGIAVLAVTTAIGIFGMKSTMLPLYGSEKLGLDPAVVGLALTLSAALGFPVSIAAGAVSDRYGRLAIYVPSVLLLAAMGVLLNLATSAPLYFAFALMFAVDGGASSMMQSMVADRASQARLGAALGTNAFFRDLAISTVPLVLGAVLPVWGFWGAGGVIAVAGTLSAAIAWRIGDTSPRAR